MSGGPVTTNMSQMAQEGGRRMAARKPTILVVTEDPEPSDAMSAWLRQAGLRVIACPGPQPPTYICAGVAAIAARSPWMPMWSSSISG
jgi:ABC-type hemin transport system substrate-binding protein